MEGFWDVQEMLSIPKSSFITVVKEIKFCGCHLIYNLKLKAPSLYKFMQIFLHDITGDITESLHGWTEWQRGALCHNLCTAERRCGTTPHHANMRAEGRALTELQQTGCTEHVCLLLHLTMALSRGPSKG